jgi:hypothetical protein
MYTLSTWRTEAGIADGFRRATTWPTDWTDYADAAYSYGPIQAGDIRGPWIFEDLQKAFDALRWTARVHDIFAGDEVSSEAKVVQNSMHDSAEAAIAAATIAWDTASWAAQTNAEFYYGAWFQVDQQGLNDWSCSLIRIRADYTYINIPDHIKTDAYLYFRTFTFFDFNDTDGLIEGQFAPGNHVVDSQSTSILIEKQNYESAPFPSNYDTYTEQLYDSFDFDSYIILKWQFSHTL